MREGTKSGVGEQLDKNPGLSSRLDHSLSIVPGKPEDRTRGDTDHRGWQDSDFPYLAAEMKNKIGSSSFPLFPDPRP